MKTKIYVATLVLGCLLAVSVCAIQRSSKGEAPAPAGKPDFALEAVKEKPVSLKTEMDKVSYAIGAQMGQSFKIQGVDVNVGLLVRGLKDAMADKDLALGQDEMRQVMTSFQRRMMEQSRQRRQAEAVKNLAEGRAFLEANKAKEGVKVLPSGLQYKVIKEGTGKTPAINDKVRTNYRGSLINGTVFDSSYDRGEPFEFAVGARVIPGWTEAVQLMKEGAKWELYIPPDLAYREQGTRTIPPNSTLIFEIELLEVLK